MGWLQAHPLQEAESASLAGGALWDLSAPSAAQKQGDIRGKPHREGPLPADADTRCLNAAATPSRGTEHRH